MKWITLNSQVFKNFNQTRTSLFAPANGVSPQMALLRKTFFLQTLPQALIAKFTGDCKFRLFINGEFVTDGPVEFGGDYGLKAPHNWWFVATQDVTKYFSEGENVICFELLNYPEAMTDFSRGQPGVAFELYAGERLILSADSSWLTNINPAYHSATEYVQYEGIGDYLATKYSTTEWVPAVQAPDVELAHSNLIDLKLPPLTGEACFPSMVELPYGDKYIKNASCIIASEDACSSGKDALTVVPGSPSTIYIAFPREICGHLELDITAGKGAIIDFFTEEIPGCQVSHFKYVAKEGRQQHRFSQLTTAQHIRVLVTCADFNVATPMPVQIHSIKINTRGFPLPSTSKFDCSDRLLMQLRSTVDNTMRMCMQRLHLDSPVHQEPLGCTGDYMIEALIAQALYGEARLACADIIRTAMAVEAQDGRIFHTSYSLLFIQMIKDYFWYTADFPTLRKVFPAVKAILNRFKGYIGTEGLVSRAPNYMFIDWVVDGDITYHHPPAELGMGAMTAFYYGALQNAEQLALQLNEIVEAAEWRRDKEVIAASIRQQLWDESSGLYKEGLSGISSLGEGAFFVADSGRASHTAYTSILAIAYGIHPIAECEELLEKILTDSSLIQPQPYFCHFLFDAICAIGKFNEHGYKLMSRWQEIIDEHPSSLKECWQCGDYSHAWGGTPAYQLTRAVLGISPLEPGYKKIVLAPCLGTLAFVEGEVPTPLGTISVSYRDNTLTVGLPRGVEIGEMDIRSDIKLLVQTRSSN